MKLHWLPLTIAGVFTTATYSVPGLAVTACETPELLAKSGISNASPGNEILQRMKAAYASLKSYADDGEVRLEMRPPGAQLVTQHGQFTTRFVAPKQYYFKQIKTTASDETYALWSDGEVFSTYWSATDVLEKYAKGKGTQAFSVSAYPTMGAVMVIAPMIFHAADLQGPARAMKEAHLLGSQVSGGRCLFQLSSRVPLNHWSGADRETVIWIDADDFLVRKIVEHTPSNASRDELNRTTTELRPKLDYAAKPGDFEFSPP